MTGTNKLVIVVTGPPCSGKSTLATELGKSTSTRHFDLDEIAKRELSALSWNEQMRDLAYRLMHDLAFRALESTSTVILSATYGRQEKRMELMQRALEAQARISLIQCKVPSEVAVQRFFHRTEGHPASDLDPERVRNLTEAFDYSERGLIVDTNRPIGDCLAEVQRYIMKPPSNFQPWSVVPE